MLVVGSLLRYLFSLQLKVSTACGISIIMASDNFYCLLELKPVLAVIHYWQLLIILTERHNFIKSLQYHFNLWDIFVYWEEIQVS